ncbi:MAG: hypothetical protein ABI837_02465 [Acidobacteriota bacterium]
MAKKQPQRAAESFGSCCKDLSDAMTQPQQSMFRIAENGVLYLSVGYIRTREGAAWMDDAVFFCPFCGTALQDKAEVLARTPDPE